ncbi:hypothetical protein FB570_111287 [Streptomyces sp. T12]|nr:hypothetical protein FB570_111287 [Streptomyces sp. T12]
MGEKFDILSRQHLLQQRRNVSKTHPVGGCCKATHRVHLCGQANVHGIHHLSKNRVAERPQSRFRWCSRTKRWRTRGEGRVELLFRVVKQGEQQTRSIPKMPKDRSFADPREGCDLTHRKIAQPALLNAA